ncbi:hypothetical protein E8E13_010938 [Curvularia kusanoi]|uniref:Uncharacterized protein n=1 Tax=Curvularia kusanoi TaxID=90978 RepID=A0A9P4WDF2_CURKU|nr:hypothetical protein E8E13_010938 [Curvularia kusanoi]
MEASTRLYARLGEIPEDPDNPDSLDDLIVCAFGAFERYYLCWRTKGGEYKQDSYGLPPALSEWLNPLDGTIRDWGSLQVVFGRGEEYFASDKNGKLEYKEPEIRKSAEEGQKEKIDRQALRRSRTVSFLRPLSQTSTRSDWIGTDTPIPHRRTSSISSHRVSRPPSLSYSATGSDSSLEQPGDRLSQRTDSAAPLSLFSRSRFASSTTSAQDAADLPAFDPVEPGAVFASTSNSRSQATPSTRGFAPSSMQPRSPNKELNQPGFNSIPEEQAEMGSKSANISHTCSCGCHESASLRTNAPIYADASVQTDSDPPQTRAALRVDTLSASKWGNSSYEAVTYDIRTPDLDDGLNAAPFLMGRMTNYFSKPGYQLGDSLSSGYQYFDQPMYYYQDEFGEDALR